MERHARDDRSPAPGRNSPSCTDRSPIGFEAPAAAPGPFRLAGKDRLTRILGTAGFCDVRVQRVPAPRRYPSPEAWWESCRDLSGGLLRAYEKLEPSQRARRPRGCSRSLRASESRTAHSCSPRRCSLRRDPAAPPSARRRLDRGKGDTSRPGLPARARGRSAAGVPDAAAGNVPATRGRGLRSPRARAGRACGRWLEPSGGRSRQPLQGRLSPAGVAPPRPVRGM
jgi:hypothetical protein